MIFRAMARIKDECPNMIALMPGQPILKDKYEKLCAELGITEMVQFMGYRRDINRLLAACDCVLASSKQEGLPLNLIEAAASGRYIIATDVRGNADVVRQSGYGALVKLDDDKAMAEEIKRAMTVQDGFNPDKIAVYDEKAIVKQVLALYADAMDGSGSLHQ